MKPVVPDYNPDNLSDENISIFIASILPAIIIYYTGNVLAGVSVFTAVLVFINFGISRVEARNDYKMEFKFVEKGDFHSFVVSISNTGGKTIYLANGGVKTKEGAIVDFNEIIDIDLSPRPQKSNNTRSFLIPQLEFHEELFNRRMQKIKPIGSDIVQPGRSNTIQIELWEFIALLLQKQKNLDSDIIELKGFFTNQLNEEYESDEWMQFNLPSLCVIAKKEMEIKMGNPK